MPQPAATLLDEDEVFAITPKGNKELKAANTGLSAADLQILILVDGFSSVSVIGERVPKLSRQEISDALRKLVDAKMVVSTNEPDSDVMGSGFSTIAVPAGFFSGLTMEAADADGGTSILKKKGYYVRIAKRPAGAREFKEGWKPTILVVDDDTDLQKLIRTYFVMEGFLPRAAFKMADIIVALRQQPMPDLILLDVQLGDGNGFDILSRLRQHPVLKTMPVVMLTAEATREAVIRGLQLGADGYVTKPFEPDALVTAVKAVLGLSPPPPEQKKKN